MNWIMSRRKAWLPILALAGLAPMASSAWGQYIGFVYPAGGQQGTTFYVKLGGQRLDYAKTVSISGEGVSARVVDFYRSLDNQELRFLGDQLRELQRGNSVLSSSMASVMTSMDPAPHIGPEKEPANASAKTSAESSKKGAKNAPKTEKDQAKQVLIDKIQRRLAADNRRPASRSLAELVFVEVTVAPDAEPGRREIRVVTTRGVTNPMAFYVGQVPEVARKDMRTSDLQVLGKEGLAKRKRPPEEEEMKVRVPCTMNGQVASGEVNRYRFEALKGQRLVISVLARELVPYIADGVPGWFQPALTLCDAAGNELAYNDDFRFKPDPALNFQVPADGEYVLTINDALFRGREDFVYRITIGELPFVTSIFPLGATVGEPVTPELDGWNLEEVTIVPPPKDAGVGGHMIAAANGNLTSNYVPFALDTLPECLEEKGHSPRSTAQEIKLAGMSFLLKLFQENQGTKEPSNALKIKLPDLRFLLKGNQTAEESSNAQKVTLPIIINGRIDHPNDWDVFEVEGRAGDTLVAEVHARRLDSPVDSFLKVTDAKGKVLAFNDDHHDVGSGMNTHHADSYLMVKLPSDGTYCVNLSDTTQNGGKEYGYRLRISLPRPDFELRVAPPNLSISGKSSASVTVYALRKDGFDGPIKIDFKNLPKGFTSSPVTLAAGKDTTRLTVKTTLTGTEKPVSLHVVGSAKIQEQEVVREAVPAEDRMQAFLWRHLMPAEELIAQVYDSSSSAAAAHRVRPPIPKSAKPALKPGEQPKFSQKQVAGLERQIDRLYQEWYLTDEFAKRELAKLQTTR